MSATAALLARLRGELDALAVKAHEIGSELARGPRMNVASVTLARVEIAQRLRGLNQRMIEMGRLPRDEDPAAMVQLQSCMARARSEIGRWPVQEALIARQVPPRTRPLWPELPRDPSPAMAMTLAADRMIGELHLLLNTQEQDPAAEAMGCFKDIALDFSTFTANMHVAYRLLLARGLPHPARFLDVGCGGGFKVLAATQFCERCDGLEYDAGGAAAAERLFARAGSGRCRVMQGDALAFEDYGAYDVIYLYRPMRDRDLLQQLEDRILAQARPRSVLVAPYVYFAQRWRTTGCARIVGDTYLIGTPQEEADALAAEAGFTGPDLLPQGRVDPGLWAPVYEASVARGFCPSVTALSSGV